MKKMDDDVIVRLKGPDRVRKRPAVIFNSDDAKGATRAVEMLLGIFITEAALGYSKELSVTIYKNNSICILSKDRGFVLDETLVYGKSVWEYDFCELFSAPREKKEFYSYGLIEEKIIMSYMANLIFHSQNTVQQNGALFPVICVVCNMYQNI